MTLAASLGVAPFSARAQAFTPDAATLWLSHFDGDANDAWRDTALTATSLSWVPGRIGQAVHVGSPAWLVFPRAGNINRTAGTIEFWIEPDCAGNDFQNHSVIECGAVRVRRTRAVKPPAPACVRAGAR